MYVARICGNKELSALAGRRVLNRNVLISGCHRMTLPIVDSSPVFPRANTLLVRDCAPSFSYCWLFPQVFPHVRAIYVLGPFDESFRHRFSRDQVLIYAQKQHAHPISHYNNIIYLETHVLQRLVDSCSDESLLLD